MPRAPSDSPPLFEIPQRPDFSIEKRLIQQGEAPVAGMDEAGRGPLAGPVVAAAVILDPKRIPQGLDDSKRLPAGERERLFAAIVGSAVCVSVASVCATTIDGINILRASLEAMRRAVNGLSVTPRYALADGRDIPPGLPCPAQALIKGDQRSQSIAAASIVAKVTRDRIMTRMASHKPHYGFESHVGYATRRHREAIVEHGPLERVHRMTFAPFRLEAEIVVEEEIELQFGS